VTSLNARYFDGRSARGHEVRLRFDATGHVEITGIEPVLRFALRQLNISSRIGNTPRSIALPNGAKCETDDNDAVDAVLAAHGHQRTARLRHRLETAWPYILALFVFTVAAVWGLVNYGVPEIARRAAFAMPIEADRALARSTLEVLDHRLFEPSTLEPSRRDALKARFQKIVTDLDPRYQFRLELRRSNAIGANAFVTDALVQLAENDEELLAVLAHEIGHVIHRHALRSVMQNSAVALLLAFALGDVVSATSLAAALPTMLVGAKFSRDFEREADRFALEFLRARHIPTFHATVILQRLETAAGRTPDGFDYLSSHPGIEERAELFGRAP